MNTSVNGTATENLTDLAMNTSVNGVAEENLTDPAAVLNLTNMAIPGRNIFIHSAIVYKQ